MVYVDKMRASYGRMVMSHMLADTLPELHAMADAIGIARKWFQNKRIPHYDVCQAKRTVALRLGAMEIGMKELKELIRLTRIARINTDEKRNGNVWASQERRPTGQNRKS